MIVGLAAAATLSALLAIAADWKERRHRAFYILKPITTLLILGLALANPQATAEYQRFIAAGLVLSTLGDVCLMFRGDGWFAAGLGSFLLAHLAFIGAFAHGLAPLSIPWWAWLVAPCGAALLALLLPRAGALKLPVVVYCVVIGAMVVTASTRYAMLGTTAALLGMIGAVVFLVSDSALAVRQFLRPYRGAQALILSTYWLGVGLIALSA